MKKNMGTGDRFARLTVAVVLAILYFTGRITGATGTVIIIIAAVFTITSVFSFCPLYSILGINTCKRKTS